MKYEINTLLKALELSWGPDTAQNSSDWSESNKARGQCVSSSLVMQDYLGGDLIRYEVTMENSKEMHYANMLDNGTIVDATFKQYTEPVALRVAPVDLKTFKNVREKRLSDTTTQNKYNLLKLRMQNMIGAISD